MSRVLKPFEFHEPETLEAASVLLGANKTFVMAGGVDLILKLRLRAVEASHVVSLQKIKGLDYLTVDDDGSLHVGAMATMRAIETNDLIAESWTAFQEGNGIIGSLQTKVMSTAIGNLCTATPVSDVTPAVLVLDGQFVIFGPSGERIVGAEEFFTGIGKTVLEKGEIVKELVLPPPRPGSGSILSKIAKTHDDISKVCVGVSVVVEEGLISDIKIALGAVAITTVRAREAEALLKGNKISDELIDRAAAIAADNISPITDVRSTKEYRKHIVKIMVRDNIKAVIERVAK